MEKLSNQENVKVNVYNAWKDIDSAKDLRKNHLTLSEYHVLTYVLSELFDGKNRVLCFMDGVAGWCKRHGMAVENPQVPIIHLII